MNQRISTLFDKDVLALTKTGERELREAGTKLTPRQLEVLVTIDSPVHLNVVQLTDRFRNMDPNELLACLDELVAKNLIGIAVASASNVIDAGDFFKSNAARASAAEPSEQTSAMADADAQRLQSKGYCTNIARRRTAKPLHADRHTLMVLIIDDDPDICKVLQLYLELEGFASRIAMNRDEILAALRNPLLPDLVLLDVVLGADLNGFDILAKMRKHPVLKDLPVIMLTAEATREAVLKGIIGGADGYVTKPFEIHPLVKAVKTVLGLKFKGSEQDWDYSL